MLNKIILLIFVILLAIAGNMGYDMMFAPEYEISTEPIDISSEPIQNDLEDQALPAIKYKKAIIKLSLKAEYDISAMLVSKRRYRGGVINYLSPWDYALVWGRVPQMIPHIKFNQVVRFCLFSYEPGAPVDLDHLLSHMSNNHLIPANDNIRRAMKRAKTHDLIRIKGYLVYVFARQNGKGSNAWKSSLKRTDKGNGACEIIYVTSLQINDHLYQ